tara:strand:- start:1363 stop:3711 length:2349 start_codon:yes stop_codon:yes gene_type:complete
MKAKILSILLLTSIVIAPINVLGEDEETFTLSGFVFTHNGDLANKTSIKVDSMASVWSENGSYVFSGISPGEHTVRAYFMNDGHTVVYRKMFFTENMELDWYEGMNWITAEIFDSDGNYISNSVSTTIEILETNENKSPNNGRVEFDLLDIGDYYTIKSTFNNPETSTQFIHFKLEAGSSTFPDLNDFDFYYGENSKYGFVKDPLGFPLSDVEVSNGNNSVMTNSDGFYLFQNLKIGSNQNFSFKLENIDLVEPINELIDEGEGWMNVTSTLEVNLPENVTFITSIQTIPSEYPFLIEWEGGAYTEYYSLYVDGEIAYKGAADSFTFFPEETGTFEFQIEATNNNGTTINSQTLLIIVIPEQSEEDLWSIGMSWNYSLVHTPEYHQNKTYTAIGSEIITDAFGQERDTFLVRVSDDNYEEGEKAYRWVDTNNLLDVKTYWVDAPSSSSYYQEGTLGWKISDEGTEVDLFEVDEGASLHFNRTNVIGVPGHPNGYDDTLNTISITKNVMVETPAGNFSTTYFKITDVNDEIVSWELWYNETVRNWVKKIDRLPGSHSDSVIFELTSFDVPITPQFITEDETNIWDDDFIVEWAKFQGAASYQLFENGVLIYEGDEASLSVENKEDGEYIYKLNAIMNSGQIVEGDTLFLNVYFILEPPEIYADNRTVIKDQSVRLSWEKVEDVAWYSIKVENSEGEIVEFYNGTENFTEINSLDIGQNRIRLQAALQNGKVSDLSPSIFVTVQDLVEEEGQEEMGRGIPAIGIPSTVLAISLAIIFKKRGEFK